VEIRIVGIEGKFIKSFCATPGKRLIIGNELKPGIYLAEIKQGNNTRLIKLIKN
jgi:hypothetical protein